MHRLIFSSILVAAIGVGCNGSKDERAALLPSTSENVARRHVVEISQMKFVPEVLNVNKGDTVVWINKDMVGHDVTEETLNSWTSSRLAAGASWTMVATRSEAYYCSLHVVMKGKIIVDGKELAMVDLTTNITQCFSRSPDLR